MTDKPMDVERTLRELSERAAPRPWTLSDDNHGWPTVTDGEGKFLFKYEYAGEKSRASMELFVACVNLEALREPGAMSVEQVHPEIQKLAKRIGDEFCGRSETVIDIIEAELCSFVYSFCTPAGRASKQEPPAPAGSRLEREIMLRESFQEQLGEISDICEELNIEAKTSVEAIETLRDMYLSMKQQWSALQDREHERFVAAPPVEGKQEPGAEAAPPTRNGLPKEVGDKFVIANGEKRFLAQTLSRLDDAEPRAAAGESTELRTRIQQTVKELRQHPRFGVHAEDRESYGDGYRDALSLCIKALDKALAASQERSATEEK